MRTPISFALGAAVGAAAAHLLDPSSGARRRNQLKDKVGSTAGQAAAAAQGRAQYAARKAQGAASKATPGGGLKDPDDVTLARKIETEIFRAADAPKGGVSIDVQAGVAYLRGEVPSRDWIERFGEDARKVQGVSGVKNLLHLPGTPAPAAEPRGAAAEPSAS